MNWIFQKPDISDINKLKDMLKRNQYRGCELSVSNLILWADYYHMEYTIVEDTLILRHTDENGKYRLSYPIGADTEEAEHAIFEMELEYFKELCQEPYFGLIDSVMYDRINQWYPERFRIQYERDWADYIYSREKLTNLAGKKLHGKRNHIKRFQEQNPEWSYETLTEKNVEECVAMAKQWCKENCSKSDEEKKEENNLVIRALRNFQKLSMKGGLLRTKEGVVAITLGSPITNDTFDVSFEKAFSEIEGAYPMINQQFVMHELQDYVYINREEDLGIEGLRKAKLSYHPEILLEKGLVKGKKAVEEK